MPPGGPPVSAAEGGPHGYDDEYQHEHGRHDAVSGLRVHPSSVTAPLTGPGRRAAPDVMATLHPPNGHAPTAV